MKLTQEIRKLFGKEGTMSLCKRFGIVRTTLYKIIKRKAWKYV